MVTLLLSFFHVQKTDQGAESTPTFTSDNQTCGDGEKSDSLCCRQSHIAQQQTLGRYGNGNTLQTNWALLLSTRSFVQVHQFYLNRKRIIKKGKKYLPKLVLIELKDSFSPSHKLVLTAKYYIDLLSRRDTNVFSGTVENKKTLTVMKEPEVNTSTPISERLLPKRAISSLY